jgi:type IV pilus assembly protein PilC
MAEFVIRLADERGRMQEQVQSAASAEELRQRFSQAGYYVHSVRPRGLGGRGRRIKLETFLIFNEQFLTLIRAGLPILGSLEMLAKNQRNPAFATQIENVAARVKTGESLSEAFAAQGAGIPVIYTTTLLAGERSGNLQEVMERFVAFERISLTFRKRLTASLIYPAVLITLVFALLVFAITFVVPRFAALYAQIGSKLPTMTVYLLAFSAAAQKSALYVLPAAALLLFLAWRWTRTEAGSSAIDGFRLRLPVFGVIWLKYQVALFSRTLSTLLSGGLPLVPSLETAARSISSRRVAGAVREAVVAVREGKSLAHSLSLAGVFPPLSVEMIQVGEQTGALPQMLNSVAAFYEEDVQTALTAALSLIEPAILVVMGAVVVFILIALYLPIFSLGQIGQAG